jgi:hypothetical protein
MQDVEPQHQAHDGDAVFDWRFAMLCRAGYAPSDAWLLATSAEVDVRLAEKLLDIGCPTATALRILL